MEVGSVTMQEKLSQVLSDGEWHPTEELVQEVGHRFSATLHKAVKRQGWQVEKRRSHSNAFEYRLVRAEQRLA